MQKVKNVTKYFTYLIFLLSISNCASQNVDLKNKYRLAYKLIDFHFAIGNNKKYKKIYLNHKTINHETAFYLKKRFGISDYLKTFHQSFARKKCEIDSILSETAQQKLDSTYRKLKIVELDPKKIKLKKIALIYPDTNLDERKVVSHITFPAIIQEKDILYAIITESDKFTGMLYLYKYEKGKWSLLCKKMLYLT
jgi:hypothetical protein